MQATSLCVTTAVTCPTVRNLETIKAYADAGFDELYIQQIGPKQDKFFTFFVKELEPQLH